MINSLPTLTVASSGNLGVRATLVVQAITYTAVNAVTAGNNITIQYANDGTGGAETVDVTGSDILVHIQSGVSLASNIVSLINADSSANALVVATLTGTDGVQVTAAKTNLAGGSTTVNYNTVNVSSRLGFSIHASFTGSTPTGTFKLQATNFPDTSTSWEDIASSSHAISANGSYMWNISDVYYNCIRLVYTATSGSGTVSALLSSKG